MRMFNFLLGSVHDISLPFSVVVACGLHEKWFGFCPACTATLKYPNDRRVIFFVIDGWLA